MDDGPVSISKLDIWVALWKQNGCLSGSRPTSISS